MMISELIKTLTALHNENGDLEVLGQMDLENPSKVSVLNSEGYDVERYGGTPTGVLFE